jgi:hypothetical protein
MEPVTGAVRESLGLSVELGRLLEKAQTRLLERAQNRDRMFARIYRAATVRESVPNGLFQPRVR